jgi:hypothetical protein
MQNNLAIATKINFHGFTLILKTLLYPGTFALTIEEHPCSHHLQVDFYKENRIVTYGLPLLTFR